MAVAPIPHPPASSADQPEELQTLLGFVKDRKELAEKVQKAYRDRWDEYYGLYRNYRRLKGAIQAAERDRDRGGILLDAQRQWGAELFIPYCFTTVETIVPRVLSTDPKMLVLPRNEAAQSAAQRVQDLINNQQKDISYDLKLQAVARSGLKFGLGVQKVGWKRQVRRVRQNKKRLILPGYQTVESEVVLFDGPTVEDVDIRDFFWDPAGKDIETCEWVIHRVWRSQDYVQKRVESGDWFPIDLERVAGMASHDRFTMDEPRMRAAGIDNQASDHKAKLHEVWEYHDRDRIITVLDKQLVVQNDVSPYFHRDLPFQIFRPTLAEHEFVGIGEIEPIAHLQSEINALRSQRRDNATLVLQKAFLYAEGFVDPDDLKIGPGKGIPIKGTDINAVIKPLEFPDIPASSYRESEEIQQDFERTTGVNDSLAGGGGGGTAGTDTATGIQLVQAAANVRIALKTKNMETETIQEAGRQFLELDRQHILKPVPIRVTDPSQDSGFRFVEVTPEDLGSDLDGPIPDAGSTTPDNPPERKNSALTLYQALQPNMSIDQQRLAVYLLREFEVADAEQYVRPQAVAPIDMQVLQQMLAQVPLEPEQEELITSALDSALQAGMTGEQPDPNEAPQGNMDQPMTPEEEAQQAQQEQEAQQRQKEQGK